VRRRCLCVTSHCYPRSWCLHQRREDPSHQHRPRVFCSTASDQQRAMGSSSARLAYTGPSTSDHQVGPVQLGSCGYFWVPAGLTAVSAQCRRSARLFTPDVRTHYSTASRTTLVTRPGAHPVPVVCSGLSPCHSTSVSVRQPAADITSSHVIVFVLSTARLCWCRQLLGQLSATTRFLWLQRGHGTGCQHRPGPPPL